MENEVRYCPKCHAACSPQATFCYSCYTSLGEEADAIPAGEESINGVRVMELSLMIERNGSRYLKIFRKNEQKRAFLHTNWAAFFLGIYWFFYRKMYGYGMACLGLAVAATFLSILLPVVLFGGQLQEIEQQVESAYEVLYSGEEAPNEAQLEALSALIDRYNRMEEQQGLTYIVCTLAFGLGFRLAISLFADCLYRHHLLKPGAAEHSGVSVGMAFAALPVVMLANWGISLLALI